MLIRRTLAKPSGHLLMRLTVKNKLAATPQVAATPMRKGRPTKA